MALDPGTNSYVTLVEADDYMEDVLNSDVWDSATDEVKGKALVTAWRLLEKQDWVGSKTNPVQPMEWPRKGVVDRDGNPVDDSTTPDDIKNGQIELAFALLKDEALQDAANTSTNEKVLQAGSARIEFFRPTSGGRFPTTVTELISQFLESSTLTAGIASGTGEASLFDDRDEYGVSEGY